MSSDNAKQVNEALDAIRKLVEMSEQKLDDNSDIVTLDHVVWRNPVADEDHDDGYDLPDNSSKPAITASFSHAPLPPSYMTKLAAETDDATQSDDAAQAPITKADTKAKPSVDDDKISDAQDDADVIASHAAASQSLEQDITELGAPIGRRGGGFYQDLPKKPAISTKPVHSAPAKSADKEIAQNASLIETRIPEPKAPIDARPQPSLSLSHQHFTGQDFSLPASEAFMTPTSLKELSEADRPPIEPEINVPLAEPPVDDPVREVQMMFHEDEPEEEWAPISQPNLQLVSDSSYEDEDEAEEGFSGTVRTALRSIIKEQVTSWLHQNMTDLIEDALSAPPQRPARPSSSKKHPKRRD